MDDSNRVVPDMMWGMLDEGWFDWRGEWHSAPEATLAAIRAAMRVEADGPPVLVIKQGEPAAVPPGELRTEDGQTVTVHDVLPADLPLGYHELDTESGMGRVVVTPGACPLPDRPHWGWVAQLYAVRSGKSWGMGDLADLRRLARWSAQLGAEMLLVNPLSAALPVPPQQPSPYYPSSRRFRNPIYLRVEEVPGAGELGPELERAAAAGRALARDRLIDRDAVFALKTEALEAIFAGFRGDPAFDRYCAAEGGALHDYATFCTLLEEHPPPWRDWPEEFRHPGRSEVAGYAARKSERVRFHQWLQWLCDEQLGEAAAEVDLVGDLPVGVDPAGADAWMWQDSFAMGMRVGLPPDEFNTRGQDWGFPPFDPNHLRAAGYEPFAQTLRAALRHSGGLRIDHVAGLFRLFWVPEGASPTEGAFVRYPAGDLLGILALEAHRAGAWVVGEDLGPMEEGVREELARRGLLSYRLLWFEPEPPEKWPAQALAAVTTHDLPTVAGLWTGADLEAQRQIGLEPNEESTEAIRLRLAQALEEDSMVKPDAGVDEVVEGTHRLLAAAPCMLVSGTLEDACSVPERPNQPGTLDEWPNWRLALPMTLEELESDPRPRRLAEILDRRQQA
jgi:4-alpha-glucanotransferase